MHVAIDTRSATPHFPGIGRYVANLVPALKQHLKKSEAVTTLQGPNVNEPFPFPAMHVSSSPFSIRQQWEIPRRLTDLKADVYHSTYFLMPYRPRVPTVLTVYDLIPFRLPALSSAKARYLFTRFLRYAVQCADEIIAISECTRTDLHRLLNVPLSRITVTPLAAAPSFRPQSSEQVHRSRMRRDLPRNYVLYLGTDRPHKNLRRLLDAWSIAGRRPGVRGWTLVLAGRWDEAGRGSKPGNSDADVMYIGSVPPEDLPALYGGAGLFVFPSLYEGFGLPVLEAMACGIPVACSAAGSLPEVGGTAARYFDPMDVDDIAETIGDVLADETTRQVLSGLSLQRVQAFSWSETARLTLDVYRKAARCRADTAPGRASPVTAAPRSSRSAAP